MIYIHCGRSQPTHQHFIGSLVLLIECFLFELFDNGPEFATVCALSEYSINTTMLQLMLQPQVEITVCSFELISC